MDLDREYRPSLLAFFRRRVTSATEAEDLVQELFARIYASPQIERETAGAYIFRAAANLVRDQARRENVRANYRANLLAEGTPVELHDLGLVCQPTVSVWRPGEGSLPPKI
jgi:RNA polymerase sigma-70 factor (ECF subfamily)